LARNRGFGRVAINWLHEFMVFFLVYLISDLSVVPIKRHFDSRNNSFHVIETQDALSKGNYKLVLKFAGAYGTSLFGLFKGVYKKQDGKMA